LNEGREERMGAVVRGGGAGWRGGGFKGAMR